MNWRTISFPYGVTFHNRLVVGGSGTLNGAFCASYIRDREPLFWRVVPLPMTDGEIPASVYVIQSEIEPEF